MLCRLYSLWLDLHYNEEQDNLLREMDGYRYELLPYGLGSNISSKETGPVESELSR